MAVTPMNGGNGNIHTKTLIITHPNTHTHTHTHTHRHTLYDLCLLRKAKHKQNFRLKSVCKQRPAGWAFHAEIRLCLHYVCFYMRCVCVRVCVCVCRGGAKTCQMTFWSIAIVKKKISYPTSENGANHYPPYFSSDSIGNSTNPPPPSHPTS